MDCLNTLKLELFFTGDITDEELKKHIEGCQKCQAMLMTLKNEKEEFLMKHNSSFYLSKIKSVIRPEKKYFGLPIFVSAAATALIIFVISIFYYPEKPEIDEEQFRLKGDFSISLFYKRDGKVYEGQDGDFFQAYDALQIKYNVPRHGYIFIFAIDADGNVYPYFTGADGFGVEVSPEKVYETPKSIVLDESTLYERLFILYSKDKEAWGRVKEKITKAYLWHKNKGGSIEEFKNPEIPFIYKSFLLQKKK